MQKGYWISCYREIFDVVKLKSYAELAQTAVVGQGGSFLVRGPAVYVSGSGIKERTVIVEWPSLEAAQNAYASDAYQEALAALAGGVDRDFRIVEGV